ncbi:MAG TPA: Npt1/Npt2 family nucleotide transporter [Steroidobacteraceae bacterium]|nr:Npt1/Npt2 family nucleotide transporter [Steroidobacteraceae bacterium]
MLADRGALTRFEKLLCLFTRMRPGEGRSVALFCAQAFLLLFAYYIVKAQREAFVLTEFSAEVRAYGVAVVALLLMFLMPAYTALRRRVDSERLIEIIVLVFASTLLVFVGAYAAGLRSGFAFFVWVSIFGVAVVAQFWAFAADTYNLKTGQRLFPVIMVGANVGGLAGAQLAVFGAERLFPLGLMLVATVALVATIAFGRPARRSVPPGSQAIAIEEPKPPADLLGGVALVLRDRYLLLIALLAILLNWINSTGEFILADVVQRQAAIEVATGRAATAAGFITAFYGSFQFWITLLGLGIQLFVVARVYRLIGVQGALLVMPVIVALGYGLVVFLPVFAIIRSVKILENSIDYTLMNTTRHALFLPVSREAKFDGKTAIDTFFWRVGDLIQAAVIFVGMRYFAVEPYGFAVLNLVLALTWIGLAVWIGQRYAALAKSAVLNVPPQVRNGLGDLSLKPGDAVYYQIDPDAFTDADPGDVLALAARQADGTALPVWLLFDPDRRRFAGIVPEAPGQEWQIEVIASDVDGTEVSSRFTIRCVP